MSTSTEKTDTILHQGCHDDFNQPLGVEDGGIRDDPPLDISSEPPSHGAEVAETSVDPSILGLHLLRHFKEGPGQW